MLNECNNYFQILYFIKFLNIFLNIIYTYIKKKKFKSLATIYIYFTSYNNSNIQTNTQVYYY